MEERDERAAAGEPDGGLAGGVAPAEDGDAGGAAELRLGRPGRVEDADALVLVQVLERQPPVLRAGGQHDGASRDFVSLLELYEVAPVSRLERDCAIRSGRTHAELPRLGHGAARELGAADPGGEAEVVLDPARRSGLAPERGALDDERVESFGRAVDGRRQSRRAGA